METASPLAAAAAPLATAAPGDAAAPAAPEAPHAASYRRNVRCIYGVTVFHMATTAVTLGPLFDAFLLDVGGRSGNALVGAVESTRGMLQLAMAYPLGVLSDRASRDGSRVRLVRWNLPLWTLGLAVVIIGVLSNQVVVIFAGVALWAPCTTCWQTSAQVMLAEYVAPEARTKALANLTSAQLLAGSLGPLLQAGLLLGLREDRWDNLLLRWVISCGCLLWPMVLLCTLGLESLQPLERAAGAGGRRGASSAFDCEALDRRLAGIKVRWWLAVTLEVATVITAVGAGMTVKYFPLFFRTDYHFSPIQVSLLSFSVPLSISIMVQACELVSRRLGRLKSVLLFHFLGTGCLWAMSYLRNLYIVLPIFVLRGALMNARGPLVRSMVLDSVTAEVRGRWNSIQSVSRFSWSGSAALGGYIADLAGDYRFTFVVTASVYTFSFLLMVPLLLICPSESCGEGPASPRQAREAALAAPADAAVAREQLLSGRGMAPGACEADKNDPGPPAIARGG